MGLYFAFMCFLLVVLHTTLIDCWWVSHHCHKVQFSPVSVLLCLFMHFAWRKEHALKKEKQTKTNKPQKKLKKQTHKKSTVLMVPENGLFIAVVGCLFLLKCLFLFCWRQHNVVVDPGLILSGILETGLTLVFLFVRHGWSLSIGSVGLRCGPEQDCFLDIGWHLCQSYLEKKTHYTDQEMQ